MSLGGLTFSRCFPERHLAVPLQAAHRKADSRPSVEGCARGNSYKQTDRVHLDPGLGEGCAFCSQAEALDHIFVQCLWLAALSELLKGWFQGLDEVFSFGLFIFFSPQHSAKKKTANTLLLVCFCFCFLFFFEFLPFLLLGDNVRTV